jgi:hypothetical protein
MPTPRPMPPARLHDPMLGIVNGLIGSLAMWAVIAGIVVIAS